MHLRRCAVPPSLQHRTCQFASSPDEIPFKGILSKEFVHQPQFKDTYEGIPILRQLNYDGNLTERVTLPFSHEKGVQMMETMVKLTVYDQVLYDIQRQGRISFYMTSTGEEAAQIASGSALGPDDVLFLQYRELGVLLAQGYPIEEVINQCFSTTLDPGKGRQMPIHYTSKQRPSVPTISSPLTTQVPHAAGAGFAMARRGEDRVAVAFFGDGAASEGDFIPALNFAATLKCQTLFICRNNGFAISTPVSEQYIGDGIAVRGVAYGVPSIRVDGNDLVAVYSAVKAARELVLREKRPALVELMTYRVGHHSTSDDASRYRMDEEAKSWQEEGMQGIGRFRRLLRNIDKNLFDPHRERELVAETRKHLLSLIRDAEANKKSPSIDYLFTDVYDEATETLKEQREELKGHLNKHADKYAEQLEKHEASEDFPFPKTVKKV